MNLRQRLLITFALVVVIVVALVAYAVSLRTRSAFEQVDQERTGALVAEFRGEFQSQGRDVVRKLERIARTDDLQRLALESAQGGDMSLYLQQAAAASRSTASIISKSWMPTEISFRRRNGRPASDIARIFLLPFRATRF